MLTNSVCWTTAPTSAPTKTLTLQHVYTRRRDLTSAALGFPFSEDTLILRASLICKAKTVSSQQMPGEAAALHSMDTRPRTLRPAILARATTLGGSAQHPANNGIWIKVDER